ncbi:MAG: ubiquinone/menaquinone biosynthesis methyltransferase [Desulfobulbaceae bacterium]|jgi:demethylmenaquinone methyltransferase/2-methoxy-6-polyprenyl-1,4-benzoquinol methylase|nr:ubiquinone/menaquinone biosynthesis methyltransferase [Desulfobulbaceae bacterium]
MLNGLSEDKGQRVRRMFDAIAHRYDLMNRAMTLGFDQSWRRLVVEKACPLADERLLDLACGTGDIAALAAGRYPASQIIAADFSGNMLKEARRRFPEAVITWLVCDANRLPFADGELHAVTFGYLLRNVGDVKAVLAEVHRVLAPGGRVVCLDTTTPRGLMAPLVKLYLTAVVPLLGKLLAGDRAAYSYLTGSTMNFYAAEDLAALFAAAGFESVGVRRLMCGSVAVHWGEKAK